MDFNPTRPVEAIVHRIRQFLDDYVIPLETDLLRSGADLRMEQLQELR
ncbi:MAG: acyl-CoA dehydrogenase, partial [Chloroflexi bacterium]|nr:acyl-CoA dehydrogenase [Chloroflexota bacterium]